MTNETEEILKRINEYLDYERIPHYDKYKETSSEAILRELKEFIMELKE